MSTPQDMTDCQARNEFGFRVGNGNAIHAPVDNSSNKPLPWVALACMFGGLGFGGLVILCLLAPWRAQGELSEAKMRAEFSDRFARVEKNADDAATVSEVWRNRVNKLEAEANANRRR